MKVEMKQTTNGVDVGRLMETINAVRAQPELAGFKFRIANRWLGCGGNRSDVRGFYGCNQEMEHAQPFSMVADEPDVLLGRDQGANPVEHLLHALAACVTTSMIYHAAAKGIGIEAVESTLEGDLDLLGFLGIDPTVRNGYQQIRQLGCFGPAFSPVYDTVTRGTPVMVAAERME